MGGHTIERASIERALRDNEREERRFDREDRPARLREDSAQTPQRLTEDAETPVTLEHVRTTPRHLLDAPQPDRVSHSLSQMLSAGPRTPPPVTPPRPPPLTPPGPKLYDVLTYLSSANGKADISTLRAKLISDGADFSTVRNDPPSAADPLPANAFERTITRTVYGFFGRAEDASDLLPSAVTSALAAAADVNGVITMSKLDPAAKTLLNTWWQHMDHATADLHATAPHDKYNLLSSTDLDKVMRSAPADAVAPKMPLLGALNQALHGRTALAGYRVLAVTDLQPSVLGLTAGFAQSGVTPGAMDLLADVHERDADTMERLQRLGYNVDDNGVSPTSIAQHLSAMFAGVDPAATGPRRFMLIDRNGQIAAELHKNFARYEHLCALVETATPGSDTLAAPIVSVAGTAKLDTFRNAIAGENAAFHIERTLAAVNPALRITPRTATIVGYDDLGAGLAQSLTRRGYTVSVVAGTPAEAARAAADHHAVGTLDTLLPGTGLLVGCTGNLGASQAQLQAMPNGAVLVSARSQATPPPNGAGSVRNDPQLSVSQNRVVSSTFRSLPAVLGQAAKGAPPLSAVLRDGTSERLLLRSGYGIAARTDLPPPLAQLDRAIVFAGAITAAQATATGVMAMPDAIQQQVSTQAQSAAAIAGVSLAKPIIE